MLGQEVKGGGAADHLHTPSEHCKPPNSTLTEGTAFSELHPAHEPGGDWEEDRAVIRITASRGVSIVYTLRRFIFGTSLCFL